MKIRINESEVQHTLELHGNKEPINKGDYYAYFIGDTAIINKCVTTVQHLEVNPNTIVANNPKTGFMANFWKLCYKVKSTTYDLTSIE